MSELVILKLGGSAITKKREGKAEVRRIVLDRIAKEIDLARKKKPLSIVVVHGAGPFGHVPAKRHELHNGYKNEKQLRGFSETRIAMETLNAKVVSSLVKAGLPAVAFQPSAGGVLKDGRISSFPLEALRRMLELGLVPVSYGDVLVDETRGFSILSGDQLVPYLAENLHAERVVLVSDSGGIYDSDPRKDKRARLIEEIVYGETGSIGAVGPSSEFDVTGGMAGKLEELLYLARDGIESEIVGYGPGTVRDALLGKRGLGTIIRSKRK